jgi:DNA invertase Pin-like site-specific DNA recombinase
MQVPTGCAVGYCRVSTADQVESGAGLEHQRQRIAQEANHRGWTLLETYVDGGLSGGSMVGRDGLAQALADVSQRRADVLIVEKLDRLSRSLLDFANLMEQSRREGWSLVALDLGLDTSTAQGEMMAAVLATFAQFERRLISQRTIAGMAVKKAQGVKMGRPQTLQDDVYARIVELQRAGLNYQKIADHLNDAGVPTSRGGSWHAGTIFKILKSRTNKIGE